MRYFKDLTFYFLEFLGSFINLCSSLLGCYPRLELGMSFLLFMESKRIFLQNMEREDRREEYTNEADLKMREAKAGSGE